MRIIVAKNYEELSTKAAHLIAGQLIMNPETRLGLATGATPIGTYKVLVKMYNDGLIDFKKIVSFNLDEYYGIDSENAQSYYYFMNKNLFEKVNIDKNNINIPNGMCEDIEKECNDYEAKIRGKGGIDLQLLGIGRNGHIGFNEPDLKFEAMTHLVDLDDDTIDANSRFFDSIDEVPKKAISMGIKTIMHSKKIVLIASGIDKADTVYDMIFGPINPNLPASALQLHKDVTVILDEDAARKISGRRGMDSKYIKIE
ncbi:glucosamine-6-phosphate deaminase [Helicovermis profundi]|uniref:Glucosamine-6-phosphate deaminase n=1 Tax=Helicovermis profundi TaxID=3065157 RepID=A0AAU9EE72_9FIRM|nr:glucosamine-6-phosphate deaminase [Clostridia bacterium S502]